MFHKWNTHLKSDKVAETDRGQSDVAIVEGVKVGPLLVVRKHGSAGGDDEGREDDGGEEQVDLGGVNVLALEEHLEAADDDRGKLVETLADALEHDEAERDADDGVEHAERLSSHRRWGRVAVA